MTNRELETFARGLRRVTDSDPSLRPFVCDGSPLTCQAFIVGANPATAVEFWPFWDDTKGFDRSGWHAAYEGHRIIAGKPRVSSTRARIDRIVEAAAPVQILETNVFVMPSQSTHDLGAPARSLEVIEYLLGTIRPAVVLAHGREARMAMLELKHVVEEVEVIESKHLSRVGYAVADDLGHRVRLIVEGDRRQVSQSP